MNSPARGRRRSGLLHFGNACTSPQVCCKILWWNRRSCKGEWTEITPKRGLTGKPWLKDGVINLIRFLWKQHADGAVVLFPAGWQSRQKDSVMGSAFYRWRQCRFHSAALVYSPSPSSCPQQVFVWRCRWWQIPSSMEAAWSAGEVTQSRKPGRLIESRGEFVVCGRGGGWSWWCDASFSTAFVGRALRRPMHQRTGETAKHWEEKKHQT